MSQEKWITHSMLFNSWLTERERIVVSWTGLLLYHCFAKQVCVHTPNISFIFNALSNLVVKYGDREVTCWVHLVLSLPWDLNSWERHINLWERDNMSWPRDHFVEVTTSLPRDAMLNDIHFSWPRLLMLKERHISSLMRKQTCVTIATQDYQKWIKHFY